MARDNEAQMILDGDMSPLRQKLRAAAQDLRQFGTEGAASVEKIGGPLKALQEKFIAIGAILAGGAVFREAVTTTAQWAQESIDLAAALGMSATAAGDLKAALASENVDVGQFVTAGQKLANTLRTNEESLNAVGLATRDAAGNLRPLNDLTVDAIELVSQYKAGTDRAVAASILFGKGFEINGDLAKINSQMIAEYTQKQRDLGIVMSEENVQAFGAFEEAGKNTDLLMRGIRQTIGNALLPALTKLAEWFTDIGPASITVIKGAIGGLIAAFWALKNGVTVVWEVINAMVITVAEPLRTLAAALYKAGTGDFKGAWEEFGKGGQTMVNAWKGAMAEIDSSSRESWEKIKNLFATGMPSATPAQSGRSAIGLLGGGESNKTKVTGKQMSESEWAQEEAAHLTRTLYQIGQERLAVEEAANKAILEADKKLVSEMDQIHAMRLSGARAAEIDRIEAMEESARHELDLGQITQAEYLARLGLFNAQRLSAEETYLAQKQELVLQDPDQNPVELERIEQERLEIRRRYAAQGLEIQRQAALESQSIWADLGDRMGGLWDRGIQAMLNGNLTWSNALRAIGTEVVGWFVKTVVGDQVKAWLAGKAQIIMAELGFATQKKAIDAASSASTIASKTTETTAIAANNAVQAGTGAAASQASIPFVGPILALAAMAAIFAAVSGLGKKTKSAAMGYDIPKGINPMVQTHEEEMILPAKYANVIRGLAGGVSVGGGEPAAPVHIHARSDKDAMSVGDLKKLLRQMGRDFMDVRL